MNNECGTPLVSFSFLLGRGSWRPGGVEDQVLPLCLQQPGLAPRLPKLIVPLGYSVGEVRVCLGDDAVEELLVVEVLK